ncbi:MAG: hypothetical protein NZ920_03230 [Aigarchaeota archaeon]|nr:hypothetical protein [Aigarchaeota archaeon]MDW8092369.1 signal recognition particle subunit SRP19/SEC65 family protein [Nitrososphaerota archaeon]
MIKREGYVIWTQYFDRSLTRSMGRRVPVRLAVKSVSQKAVIDAARSLGWHAEPVNRRYPRRWWQQDACVIVRPEGRLSRSEVVRRISEKLR